MPAYSFGDCWYFAEKMDDYYRVVLEPAAEGVYIFIFKTQASTAAELDFLQNDIQDAKRFCSEVLGLSITGWKSDSSIIKLMS